MTRSPAINTSARPFAVLAEHLAALRAAARLPQRSLAQAASISRGAVQRAESGTAAPTPDVLEAYLRACRAGEADRERARLLRVRGRTAQRDRIRELKAPAPDFIHDKHDLGRALAKLYEQAGAPCLSDGRLTPGRKLLPRTTAWRIVNRQGMPASREQLVTFLTACGVPAAAQRPYIDAYHRIRAHRGNRRVPPRVLATQRVPRSPRMQLLVRRIPSASLPAGGSSTDVYELTDHAAAIARLVPARLFEDTFAATLRQWASGEAHRNGTVTPGLITATSMLSTGIDLDGIPIARADDRGVDTVWPRPDESMAMVEAKTDRDGPGPGAVSPDTWVPQPPRPAPNTGKRAAAALSRPGASALPQPAGSSCAAAFLAGPPVSS
ncbi:helix-turn-helix transcriptional regulator [Streptomyces sp. NPDC091215]|uniref:helix-turn-helix domain-containing protein n=1 Tax=Streptomyces sp. NPDC091215 TaxID=3155192 RepID=UPI0034201B3C